MTSPLRQVIPGTSPLANDIDPWGTGGPRHSRTLSTLSSLSQSPGTGTGSPLRRRRQNGHRISLGDFDEPPHPLTPNGLDALDSRPTLTRLLSETERQVAESSTSGASSTRGSLDLLRMSKAEEVEVFVHQVKANESLAGIALLYGIDLQTLRKTNKLWPSDPVHLRTHLYIPLEACRWNKASETFTRGPGEGQAILTPKTYKGKDKARALINAVDDALDLLDLSDLEPSPRASMDTLRPPPPPRVLDIVRIPSSQLVFFPRAQTSGRPSLELRRSLDGQKLRRTASLSSRGPDIHHDLMTLPSPLKPPDSSPKSKFVRLRPPTAPARSTRSDTLADKLSSLFTVPPPPSTYAPLPSRPPRTSTDSLPSSPRPSPIIKQPEVILEMSAREPRQNRRKKDN